MTDLYDRMRKFSDFRFALFKNEGPPDSIKLKLRTPRKASYAVYLETSKDSDNKVYVYDSAKQKFYRLGSKIRDNYTKIETMEEILEYMEAPEQIYCIFKEEKGKFLSEITLGKMRKQLGEKIKFPGDGFLTFSQDSASLDLNAIVEKTRKKQTSHALASIQVESLQRLGCKSEDNGMYSDTAVCFELIMAFLDNNKDKKQITIAFPNQYITKLTHDQKEALKEKLGTLPNLSTLVFPDFDFIPTQFSVAQLKLKKDEEWMSELRTMSTKSLNEWVSKLFADISKGKDERLKWMEFLQSDHPWLGYWTKQQKDDLLELSCSLYTEGIKTVLGNGGTDQGKLNAAFNLISEFISTKKVKVGAFTDEKQTELQNELNSSLEAYKKLGGLSSSRVKQVQELKNTLGGMTQSTCIGLLKTLQEAKKEAMKEDRKINASSSFFKMNRKGHSRFFNAINEMYFSVLKQGADQLDEQYHTYVSNTFKELLSELEMIPWDHSKNLSFDVPEKLTSVSVQAILIKIEAQLVSMPGHVKTVANEVLLHGSALLTQLKSAPKEDEGDGEKPISKGGIT